MEQINRFLRQDWLGQQVWCMLYWGCGQDSAELKHLSSQDHYCGLFLSRHFCCLLEGSSTRHLCIRNLVLIVIPTPLSHPLCSAKVFFTSSAKSLALGERGEPHNQAGKAIQGKTPTLSPFRCRCIGLS